MRKLALESIPFASLGLILIACSSKAQRDITYCVPGFHGLFSQKANRPPGFNARRIACRHSSLSAGGM